MFVLVGPDIVLIIVFGNFKLIIESMRQSLLFTKTLRHFPKDEESINARYLIRAGYIRKSSAGVFSYLPLGWRVLDKINQIVREEMDAIGGQELLLPALIAKKYWVRSQRWKVPIAYKVKAGRDEYGLGWTHEEVAAHLAEEFIRSEKDLPQAVYQIQTKFRLEPRARGGLIRLREFVMKDLYSFHRSEAELKKFYDLVAAAYQKIFKRLALPVKIAEAAGGDFTKEHTHEFQVLAAGGEDVVFYCGKCAFAQNKEIARVIAGGRCPRCSSGKILESRAIEAGNIFKLGQRFSPWWMGSYGLGPSRIMAALVEVSHDDRGLIWPPAAAPYQVHLLALNSIGRSKAEKFYRDLRKRNIAVLYDDRPAVSAGEKLMDADLLGMPWRLVVSEKTGNKIEVKARSSDKARLESVSKIIKAQKSS